MKNLLIRCASGLAYLLVMVGCLLFCKWAFLGLLLLILTVAMWEFHRMNIGRELLGAQIISIATGWVLVAVVFAIAAFGISPKWLLMVLLPILALSTYILSIKDHDKLPKVQTVFTSLLYIALPISTFSLLMFKDGEFSGVLMLCLFALVWMSDVGAYCFGCTLGQKFGPKLCPTISPHKSWIGVIGGCAVALGTAALLSHWGFLPFGIWRSMGLALVIDIAGVLGDLVESMWKRHAGIKDSGKIIPGHGGMLDRFDSALFAIPAAAIYIMILGF